MLNDYKLIDLSHTLNPNSPTWEGNCGFNPSITHDYPDDKVPYRVQRVDMRAGCGTHLDAPAHFAPGASCIHQMSLDQFLCKAHVIDVSHKCTPDYFISAQDIKDYEKTYGKIEKDSMVIGYTGWEKHWNDPKVFRGLQSDGSIAFPGFSGDAASFLLERDVAGLAIDTLSPDANNSDFPVHKILLGAEKYIIENIANAGNLPKIGGYIMALPLKMENLTESSVRAVGFVPK